MLLYRITNPEHVELLNDWAQLDEALQQKIEYEPTGSQWRGIGFSPYSPAISEDLVWSGANGVNLFSLMIHERALTAATIREYVLARGKVIEDREGRKVYKKEYAEIKDNVLAELLPKAFIKRRRITALVIGDLLVVGASSAKLAEDFLNTLREAMGSLGVRPFTTTMPSKDWMTRLMQTGKMGGLVLGDTVKMVNELKDTAQFKGIDLKDDEPQSYLMNGFDIKEMGVFLDTDLYFKLTDTLIFKGMKFSETLITGAHQDADGDQAAIIDADIILTTDVIRRLVDTITTNAGEDRAVAKVIEKPGLRLTHINNVALDDLMSPAEKLASLQEQFGGGHAVEDEELETEDF